MIVRCVTGNLQLIKKFLIGLFAGIVLGMLMTDRASLPCNRINDLSYSNTSDYEPKLVEIVTKSKTTRKKLAVSRPRYLSTELGIKKKLFVGVLTSNDGLKEHGSALNKTMIGTLKDFAYFTHQVRDNTLKKDLIVHEVNPKENLVKATLNIILHKYLESYDYVFFIQDDTYIKGGELLDFLNSISTSQNVMIGHPNSEGKCSLRSGILFSNSVFRILAENASSTVSAEDNSDVFISKLMSSVPGLECNDGSYEGLMLKFKTFNIQRGRKIWENDLQTAITIHPIKSSFQRYEIHITVCQMEERDSLRQIKKLQEEILATKIKFSQAPLSWPVGYEDHYKPETRFDQFYWQYFNASVMYFPDERRLIKVIRGSDKVDLEHIIAKTVEFFKNKYPIDYKLRQRVNGYRKVDPTRGIDYLLDLEYCRNFQDCIVRRAQIFKGLSNTELLNVPYVTENIILTLIIPMLPHQLSAFRNFVNHYTKVLNDSGRMLRTIFVFKSNVDSATAEYQASIKSEIVKIRAKYKNTGTRIMLIDYNIPEVSPQVIIMDLLASRFYPNSLVAYIQPQAILKDDFLKRIRMNCVLGFQVFFPIPFAQYNPKYTKSDSFKIRKSDGYFDQDSFDYAAFYFSDFKKARESIAHDVPLLKKESDIVDNLEALSSTNYELIEVFLKYRDLHVLRAVDKSLLVHYLKIKCDFDDERCKRRKMYSYGSHKTLGNLVLKYQHPKFKAS